MRYIEKSFKNGLVAEADLLLRSSRHYNQSGRVREIIRLLYSGCCCYCGSSPESTSFFQIEHFYPKKDRKYARFAKDIRNLHYSCQRCNTLKGAKVHPNIFSPNFYLKGDDWFSTLDHRIDRELFYVGHLLYSVNLNVPSVDRGGNTVSLFNLNNENPLSRSHRRSLVEERIRVFAIVYQLLEVLYELIYDYIKENEKAIRMVFLILMKYTRQGNAFHSMIIQNFGNDIYQLLFIFLKLRTVHKI